MKLYRYRIDTILDPFLRIMIQYDINQLIGYSNEEHNPHNVTYHSSHVGADIELCRNKITVSLQTSKMIVYNDRSKFIKQTIQHINPFSHHHGYIAIQRKEVPIGKFRVHNFKNTNPNYPDDQDDW